MKKAVLGLMLVGLFSTSIFAQNGKSKGKQKGQPSYNLPEPTGLAELAACAVGLGVFALRRRKTSV